MRLRTLVLLLSIVSAIAVAVVSILPDPPEVRRSTELAARGSDEDGLAELGSAGDGEEVQTRGKLEGLALHDGGAAGFDTLPLAVEVLQSDGRPAPRVSLRIASTTEPQLEGLVVEDGRDVHREATTDVQGRATFGDLPVGAYSLEAVDPEGRRSSEDVGLARGRTELRLTLPERPTENGLLVRVVDAAGAPVAGARVEVHGGVVGATTDRVGNVPELVGTTGGDGVARFADAELEGGVIVATAPDGRAGLSSAPRPEGHVVTVAEAGVLEGSLTGMAPERFLDTRVLAYALDRREPYAVTHGLEVAVPVVDGRYRFESLPAGTWTLALEDPGGARLVLPPATISGRPVGNSVDPLAVQVLPGRTVSQDLETKEGGWIEGRVLNADGEPVVEALVRTTLVPQEPTLADGFTLHGVHVWRFDSHLRAPGRHPVTHRSTRTDAIGSYHIGGLPPGRHRLEVLAAGLTYDRIELVTVEDGARTNLEHSLLPAGAIQGFEPRAGLVGLEREGSTELLMIAVLPRDGRFTFGGLAPGAYVVVQLQPDPAEAPAPLAKVEVVAGRTTWIDLSSVDRPVRLAGRVIDAKGPVAGARVRVDPETCVTDTEGRFEMRSSFPLEGPTTVQVLRGSVETWFALQGMSTSPGEESDAVRRDFVLGDAALSLRTVDESGTPVPARVEISTLGLASSEDSIEAVRFEPVFVDETGEHVVEGLLPGEYAVSARFENGAEARADVSIPSIGSVELHTPPVGDLDVVVLDESGTPQLGRWIGIETWIDVTGTSPETDPQRERSWRWAETDVDGRARFRGVAAGSARVQVRAVRSAWAGEEAILASDRIELGAGEMRTLELVLKTR